jgi:hypothetical protein
MTPEVKAKTCELLRSGTIKQITGQLVDGEGCRCVLGVIALAGDIPHDTDQTLDAEGNTYDRAYEGFGSVGLTNDDCVSLYIMNDRDQLTFPQLADVLEADF